MAIYTKRGDRGSTDVFEKAQKKRVAKDSLIVSAIGAIDELNSSLGVAKIHLQDKSEKALLEVIQKDLFAIGANLAGIRVRILPAKTRRLETALDRLEGTLPVLKNFILPGGSQPAAYLHLSRSICRRAERALIALNKEKKLNPNILTFINRLSDALFMLAREQNLKQNVKEVIWKRS